MTGKPDGGTADLSITGSFQMHHLLYLSYLKTGDRTMAG
jgi:hypothetical protein